MFEVLLLRSLAETLGRANLEEEEGERKGKIFELSVVREEGRGSEWKKKKNDYSHLLYYIICIVCIIIYFPSLRSLDDAELLWLPLQRNFVFFVALSFCSSLKSVAVSSQ